MQGASLLAPQLRAAAAAVAFLTTVPVGRRLRLEAADVARGALLFPLIGAGIGAAAGVVATLLHPHLPALAAAGVALALELVLTGAMHLDGLADTADALAARTRERALEIMRDPRTGTFGAAAVALNLLMKAALIAALLGEGTPVAALAAAGAIGRAAGVSLAAALPYARDKGGSGGVLSGRVTPAAAAVAVALAAAIAVGPLGAAGAVALGAAAVAAVALALTYRRWLAGVTGDTLGAATEICGTIVLLAVVAAR